MKITDLLILAVERKASEIHLSSDYVPMIRVNGDIEKIQADVVDYKLVYNAICHYISDEKRKNFDTNLEVDFAFTIPKLARFRVTAFTKISGMAAVFRVIPLKVPTLSDILAPKIFTKFCDLPSGLIIITGPTGSGKSTTQAAMMNYINHNNKNHILTIEDPIEFVHYGDKSLINQREISTEDSIKNYSHALKSALRSDPDNIFIGEMRDLDTIRLALTAAETGHLVFSTLHTSSAAKTINRIVDVFPSHEKSVIRSILSYSLRAVISQILIKKKGGNRIAVREIMVVTPAIRNMIKDGKISQIYSAIQTGSNMGMFTLAQDFSRLVKQGLIDNEEVKSHFD